MQVLINRNKSSWTPSIQRNGPDLEICISRGRETSNNELEELSGQFLHEAGIKADRLEFIEYEKAFKVFTTTYQEAKTQVWQEPERVELKGLILPLEYRGVDVGDRLVPNYSLSPSGDTLVFTSVLKSGRAISNLYSADLQSGKITLLTTGASVRLADISANGRTIAYIDDYFGRQLVVLFDLLSLGSIDGTCLGMYFHSIIIGKDFVFCEVEPERYASSTFKSLIEEPAFLAYAPRERELHYLSPVSKPKKFTAARGADVYIELESDDTLSVYDMVAHKHRLLRCKHLSGSISDVRIGTNGCIVVLCTDAEGYAVAFHRYNCDSREHFAYILPRWYYIHEWAVSGLNNNIIFSRKETPGKSHSGSTIEVINRGNNTLNVIERNGYFRSPQISTNGNRIAWMNIGSNKATYGYIYTGIMPV